MQRVAKTNLRYILLLLAVYILNAVTSPISYVPSLLYGFLTLLWGFSVRDRLTHRRMRQSLFGMALMLCLMFPLRVSRWMLPDNVPALSRFLWYAAYIPSNSVPLFSFSAALCVSTEETAGRPRLLPCWAVTAVLTLLALTNDLHGLVFRFQPDGEDYEYGLLFSLMTVWSVLLTLAAFAVLLRRCRLSQCRKRWYLPVIAGLGSFSLLIWYMALGGSSPQIGNFKLFHYHEIFALVFLAVWEECIVIGLVPSNSGYGELFSISHLNAEIRSTDGAVQISAGTAQPPVSAEDDITRTQPIGGGTVTWHEDRSAIRRINREISEAVERIEEENDLIAEETRIAAERLGYETQNRLYDRISAHCRTQLSAIADALQAPAPDDDSLRHCLHLGTYIKRSANLILTGSRNGRLSAEDLLLSVRELFDNLRFAGTVCELRGGTVRDCPAEQIIAAFDLLEAVFAQRAVHACSVFICPDAQTLLRAEFDAEPLPAQSIPAVLHVTQTEEDGVTSLVIEGAP